jgi:hypothetical protein
MDNIRRVMATYHPDLIHGTSLRLIFDLLVILDTCCPDFDSPVVARADGSSPACIGTCHWELGLLFVGCCRASSVRMDVLASFALANRPGPEDARC